MRLAAPFLRRTLIALCAAICLSAAGARASEPTLRADFDGDGLHDRVTRDHREPSLVHVWLSRTHTTSFVRFAAPLAVIGAVDLDGDRRAELVASDDAAGLHVWTKASAGFTPVKPRGARANELSGTGHGAIDDGPSSELPSDSDIDSSAPGLALAAPVRGSPRVRAPRPPLSSPRCTSVLPLLPRGPRPPPAFVL
jgi:hypothetical protein